MPRREGYPRVQTYAPDYVLAEKTPIPLLVNSKALIDYEMPENGDGVWATVRYPQYNAVIYYTFTPVVSDNLEKVLENRLERIRLDLAGSNVQWSEWEGEDDYVILAECPSALSTPLKLVRVKEGWVESATAFFASAQNVDSMAPLYQELRTALLVGNGINPNDLIEAR